MPTHGKNYRKSLEGVDLTQRFSVEDAVAKSLGASFAKFDETVDVALRLGVDPKYSDQMVRGAVSLPHGLGKTVRVAVFCKGEKQAEATAAGADVVGAEDLVAQIKGGWLEFDAAVAAPDVMALVGQVGRVLGPRGLMPNAKTGTVTFDVAKAVQELKAGRVDFKVDKEKKPWAATGWKPGDDPAKRAVINSLYIEANDLEEQVVKRYEKYAKIEESESDAELYLCDDAEIVITAFGATSRIVKSAVNKARAEGIKVGMFRPITLWPFPKKQLLDACKNAKNVLSVEMNMGQMVEDVKLALDCKLPVSFFGRTGGIIPTPNEVLAEIKKLNGGAQ